MFAHTPGRKFNVDCELQISCARIGKIKIGKVEIVKREFYESGAYEKDCEYHQQFRHLFFKVNMIANVPKKRERKQI